MRKAAVALAVLSSLLVLGAACLLDDKEEEFLAYCTDRYGMDRSHNDCECYWEEMREDGIAPGDIVGMFRNDDGIDLRAGLAARRANDRCFR